MKVDFSLFDVFLLTFMLYLGYSESLWWLLPTIVLLISWFVDTGWNKKEGFYWRLRK